MSSRCLRPIAACAAALLIAAPCGAAEAGVAPDGEVLRVCADPDNLPYSNAAEQGFENRIARVVAAALGRTLSYDEAMAAARLSLQRG
jgi:hypothetical protein